MGERAECAPSRRFHQYSTLTKGATHEAHCFDLRGARGPGYCSQAWPSTQARRPSNGSASQSTMRRSPTRGQTWSWKISNGLKAVGTGTKAWWAVDTVGSGQTGAPSWAIVSIPGGSAATLDSTGTMRNSLTTDVVGQYIVSVTVGTKTVYDSIWASNYRGMTADANAGCLCHGEQLRSRQTGSPRVTPRYSPKASRASSKWSKRPARVSMQRAASAATPPDSRPSSTTGTSATSRTKSCPLAKFMGFDLVGRLPTTADGGIVMITQGDQTTSTPCPPS